LRRDFPEYNEQQNYLYNAQKNENFSLNINLQQPQNWIKRNMHFYLVYSCIKNDAGYIQLMNVDNLPPVWITPKHALARPQEHLIST